MKSDLNSERAGVAVDALVRPSYEPHPSHDMTDWEHTIVMLVSTSRFGKFRMCKNCEAEQAETVAGKAMHDELKYPCSCAPNMRVTITVDI